LHEYSEGGIMKLLNYITDRRAMLTVMIFIFGISHVFTEEQTRKATQKQIALYKEIKTVFSGSIPSCPEGWSGEKPDLPDPDENLPDADFPFHYFYQTECKDDARKQASDDEIQKAIQAYWNPARKAELDKLNKENEKLAKQLVDAAIKNDQAVLEKLQKETDDLQQRMQAFTKEDMRIMERLSAHDVNAIVSFSVNEFSKTIYGSLPEPIGQIAGCPAFRTKGQWNENTGWHEGVTYILLGKNWTLENGTTFTAAGLEGHAFTTVQTIIAGIQADPVRAKQIAGKISWNPLKRLISDP
jgi:hypothetical protein